MLTNSGAANHVRVAAMIALLVLLAAIFIGGAVPGAGSLFPAPWDKLVHFIVYGGMGVLAGLAFPRLRLPVVVAVVVVIGGFDEIHQIFLPGRHAGLDDLTADLIGGALFLPILLLLRRLFFTAPARP